ncbi:MAG: thioredoxin family protein [Gemmataceae bacterium]
MCTLVILALAQGARAEEIRWRRDYSSAVKEASEKGVPLLINVGTLDCFWCKQLDGRTFSQEEMARLINDRFIPLKLDAGNPANNYLVQALKVHSYPTLIYASHDGNILGYREGFLEADALKEQLTKVLASVGTPDWMQRDFDAGTKAIVANDYGKAISLLRNVVEDGKSRPVQVKARTYLAELEKRASEDATRARDLADRGKTREAIAALDKLNKSYPGTLAARRGTQMMAELVSRSSDERKQQASELLRLAREDYRSGQYLVALDRCEEISTRFADLSEAASADKLAGEIKDNPEWTRKAAEQLGDRLSVLYLSLADTWLKKGQPQQAIFYLERIQKMFPGTRHADLAGQRLSRLRGSPMSEKP